METYKSGHTDRIKNLNEVSPSEDKTAEQILSEEKQMTPLSDLIKRLEYDNVYQSEEIKGVIKLAQSLLPKEKQGIIEAYQKAKEMMLSDEEDFNNGEEYFNSKYNQ